MAKVPHRRRQSLALAPFSRSTIKNVLIIHTTANERFALPLRKLNTYENSSGSAVIEKLRLLKLLERANVIAICSQLEAAGDVISCHNVKKPIEG